MQWRHKVNKALLQREINQHVDEFAAAMCESLEYLKENIQRAIGQLEDIERDTASAHSLMSTLSYLDELMSVLKCPPSGS